MTSLVRRLALGLCAAATFPALARAQQTGTITGRVVSRDAHQPLSDVSVFVVGTQHGSRTAADGTYRILGVPAGAVQLRAQRIGYAASTQAVTVPAEGSVTADFELSTTAVQLDVVVTTATGEQQRKKESGASVASIKLDTVAPPASMNFSQLATGKAAGVVINQSSGTTGTGARIRIRGANSVSLSNEPLLIIDGVRADNSAEANSIWVGGQTPSRINDINPDDIESIEIIKGPAASALYGTAAANGVIQVTTKRGRTGPPRWTAFAETGVVRENNKWPPNYGSWIPADPANGFPGVPDSTGGTVPFSPYCNLDAQGQGWCGTPDSVSHFNPMEQYSPFRTGAREKYGVSVSGGSGQVRYYLSGSREAEGGIYQNNNLNRYNLRANLSADLAPSFDISVDAGYLKSDLQLTQNDDNYAGVVSNGLAGDPFPGRFHGYYPFGPDQIFQIQDFQNLDRFTGGVTANYRPLGWLRFTSTVGGDAGFRLDQETYPPNVIDFSNYVTGSRTANRLRTANFTSNVSGTATFTVTPELQSSTTAGVQYQSDELAGVYGYGEGLTGGTNSLGGVTQAITVSEATNPNKTFGAYATQEFGWRDRLFLTAALRGDKNSAFGKNLKFVTYPSVSLSYVISDEPFFPQIPGVSSLRLRGAYGQSGLRPGVRDAQPYFVPVAVARRSPDDSSSVVDLPGITIGGSGNADLKPEKSGEAETGFDLGLFGDRASFEVTYYNKISRDALISRPLPPSTGGPTSRYENLGSVQNKGLETLLRATLLQGDRVGLDATITAAWLKNRLTSLGQGIPAIQFGYGVTQRHQEGYPLGGYWGYVITGINDANNDGIIDYTEVTLSSEKTYLGNSMPTRQASFAADLTLFRNFKLSGLLDYRGGYKQLNYSEYFRCLISTCAGINLPTSTPFEQARAAVAYEGGSPAVGSFLEDADFWKLRELSLTVTAPNHLAHAFRTSALSLTLSGRNLGTWTKYTGLDPEVNVDGQANFTQADFLSQPQVRYWTARLNVTF